MPTLPFAMLDFALGALFGALLMWMWINSKTKPPKKLGDLER